MFSPKFYSSLCLGVVISIFATPLRAEVSEHPADVVTTAEVDPVAELAPDTVRIPQSSDAEWPLYEKVTKFDNYVQGRLSDAEAAEYKKSCRKRPKHSPFCFSLNRGKELDRRIHQRARIIRPGEPVPVIPTPIEWVGDKLKNWKKIRAAKVPALLKALQTMETERVREIGRLALAEKRCPNTIAVAVAATLEDQIPNGVPADEIGALYEKGGSCLRRNSVDREHCHTRAALLYIYKGAYREAEKLLSKVHPTDAMSGRALYWLYRSRLALGNAEGAEQARQRLATRHRFSFHALVSAVASGADLSNSFLDSTPQALMQRSKRSPLANKMIEQAELLTRFGFDTSGALMVDWTLDKFSRLEPNVQIYLASLGDASVKVTTLPSLLIRRPSLIRRETMELAYPQPYRILFDKQKTTVDPYLMLAVARKESRFDSKAISPANAQGLMQINPDTAVKLTRGEVVNLLDPEKNIALGAQYLNELLKRMGGKFHLVLASYNAGEEAVEKWVKRYRLDDAIHFIDLIPYRETRDYVGYVITNYYWYHRLYDPNPKNPLSQLVSSELAKK